MLAGDVYIVTGAGRGLGEEAAVELGRHGASVVVNDLGVSVDGEGQDEEPAERTARAVREVGGNATVHFGDVTSLDYCRRLVGDTVEEYGRIDGVTNFAGIVRDAISYEMTGEQWDDVIDVHLRGHFALLRSASEHWVEQAKRGDLETERSFLAVSSRSAFGNVGQLNYSAAKAGVLGMVRTAARELYRHDVRVNALVPTAYTRMIEEIPEDKRPFTEEEMPPEKVAPVVAYLLSDEAAGINGWTVRSAGDQVGLITDPELRRVAFQSGGWTVDDLADRFRETVCDDQPLDTSTSRSNSSK